MIDNQQLPIGFTMELSKHLDALNHFASLPKDKQTQVIEGAKQMHTHDEMRNYVENLVKL